MMFAFVIPTCFAQVRRSSELSELLRWVTLSSWRWRWRWVVHRRWVDHRRRFSRRHWVAHR
jgi:hypothetical protein